MSRVPSKSQSLAMRAAAAIAAQAEEDETPETAPAEAATMEASPIESAEAQDHASTAPSVSPVAKPSTTTQPIKRGRGRPKNKREVEARHTVYLDKPRHLALARLAEDRGRSVHSLILEGIDHVIGKPQSPGWQGR